MTTFVNGVDVAGRAPILDGPGLACKLASVSVTGTGSDIQRALTLPFGFSPLDGQKVRLDGIILVENGAGAVICSVQVLGLLVKRSSGPTWTVLQKGNTVVQVGPSCGTYFTKAGTAYTAEELPGISDNGGSLSVVLNPIATQVVTVGFRGSLANNGF